MVLLVKGIFDMDNNRDWYVYFDDGEMNNMDNDVVSVNLNLILHL